MNLARKAESLLARTDRCRDSEEHSQQHELPSFTRRENTVTISSDSQQETQPAKYREMDSISAALTEAALVESGFDLRYPQWATSPSAQPARHDSARHDSSGVDERPKGVRRFLGFGRRQ
jgi:hypothetical protein